MGRPAGWFATEELQAKSNPEAALEHLRKAMKLHRSHIKRRHASHYGMIRVMGHMENAADELGEGPEDESASGEAGEEAGEGTGGTGGGGAGAGA